ncbi:YdeI/OmpD-associated family protein [Rasiella sp. SM2506]|uniref:YdeI/OmpD-associated family protein n=1 Tax=Rasiella sp. SM2506 TaxID=3423914 RepID=UPI003D79C285
MLSSEKVTQYIEKHVKWSTSLSQIREVLKATALVEEIKWGAPSYSYNSKILIGLGAFKNHMGIWFHQGVFLKDKHQKLLNAQDGKTKALRQWRLEEGDIIDTNILRDYIEEAIENCKAGKEVKAERITKKPILDPFFKDALAKNTDLKKAFDALTPGKQREYAEHIASAKRETTRLSRLEKITSMILAGQGLHDKYKNC